MKKILRFHSLAAALAAFCALGHAQTQTLQPAAKVDGIAISQQSVNQAVPEDNALRKKAQLATFVSEQLLANAAVREKLDADPAVTASMDTARRQILARAYIAKRGAAIAKPSAEEVRSFFNQHPELFSARRIYRLQQILATVAPERINEVTDQFHRLKTFNARADWLKKAGIPFTVAVAVKPAEDLPMDLLTLLTKAKKGDTFNVPGDQGITTVQVTGVESKPLTLPQAQAYIERFLANQRIGTLINQETERLRGSAKIEYFAPYAAKAN
jgi:EpsD family peptidyl-prolyl cis-trans isomerase